MVQHAFEIDFIYPAVSKTIAKTLSTIANIKSSIVVPLQLPGGKVIGTFMVGDRVDRDISQDIPVLKEFADHIAIAISKKDVIIRG